MNLLQQILNKISTLTDTVNAIKTNAVKIEDLVALTEISSNDIVIIKKYISEGVYEIKKVDLSKLVGLDVDGNKKIGSSTNYTNFDENGHQTMIGSATVFDDLIGDITGVKTSGPGVSANTTENTLNFVDSANLSDYAYFNYQLSHKWKIGSSINPHIHYEQNQNKTPNFLFQYRWQRQGNTKTTSWVNLKSNTNAFTYVSGTLNQICEGLGIDAPVGYGQVSDIIQIRLLRDTTNASGLFAGADAYTGTVLVTSADVHFEIDSLGSNEEYTK